MKLVHAADIHLDSALRGLDRIGVQHADEVRLATRRALENLVRFVIDDGADLLVIAGDLYDGDWNDYGTGQFFVQQMGALADADVPVVLVSGNHDAASRITRSLRLPPNVVRLGTDGPESREFADLGVVVHGQSYANRDVQHNLASAYPHPVDGLVNVGVLHTSAAGYDGHKTYAPCSRADLEALRYHYLALGHVHTRQAVVEGDRPAWFSGNLQGRHARETGPKGVLGVELGLDRPARVTFQPLDAVRWERLEVDATGLTSEDEILDAIRARAERARAEAGELTVIGRLALRGTTPVADRFADVERLRAELENIGARAGVVWEKLDVRLGAPPRPDPEAEAVRSTVRAVADALASDADGLGAIAAELPRVARDIAAGRLDGQVMGVDLTDPHVLGEVLADAVAGLDAQLAGGAR